MDSYAPGNTILLEGTITDTTSGLKVDPTTVTCVVRPPNGPVINPAVTRKGLGEYSAEVNASVPGIWAYRFVGTGASATAQEGAFFVRVSTV